MNDSVFGRLNTRIGGQRDGGISPIDLATLPPNMRRIMRIMLREVELTEKALMEQIAALPEDEQIPEKEVQASLVLLSKDGWLIKLGEGQITYKVNLRRKAPRPGAVMLWSKLDDKIAATRKDSEADSAEEEG